MMKKIKIFSISLMLLIGSISLIQYNSYQAIRTDSMIVDGMSCEACSIGIKNTVSELKGVEHCDVSFENKKVTVTYNSKKVPLVNIKKIIENEGYSISQN